jgi:hypothetical protein
MFHIDSEYHLRDVPSWQVPSTCNRRIYGALRIAQRHPSLFQRIFRRIFP